ncbi:MAG: uroporphyrinogen decarboxylase family protein [Tepidisphaerales bacterium]
MTSRERFAATLAHRQPDRVCVDFGATFVTGIHVSVVHRLRQRLLGDKAFRVKVCEPYQMLGEVDDQLRQALGIDIVGALPRKSMFGTEGKDWKELTLFDGTPCLVPGTFNVTPAPDGGWHIYPEGDTTVGPSGHMPRGGHFFDAIIRQDPIDESKLNPADNTEEFGLLSADDLAYYRAKKQWFQDRAQFGSILIIPGTAFGDIALVPGPWLKHPRGIRDVSEWYMATIDRKDYVRKIFDKQLEFAIQNVNTLIDLFGDVVQVALITGTDFGTQMGPFIAPDAYREMFKPYHKVITDLIHQRSPWKCFIHSCGAVRKLIPDFIDAGFDVLNPVQCSAVDMDAARLKQEFGKDIVFWGGGVDTQKTLAFGVPQQVYAEVTERIRIFNRDGGFVFNTVHNVQGNTPIDNVEAMFRALRESK